MFHIYALRNNVAKDWQSYAENFISCKNPIFLTIETKWLGPVLCTDPYVTGIISTINPSLK